MTDGQTAAGYVESLAARVVRRPLRVFASSRGLPPFRRASDVLMLVPALLVLAGLIAAYPPSRLERSLASFLDSVPSWLDPVWQLAYDLLSLTAVALVLATLVTRRFVAAAHALTAVVVAGLVAEVSARLATGEWSELDNVLGLRADGATFPVARVAVATATILTVAPHVVRPLRRACLWILAFGVVAAALFEPAAPGAILTAFAIGLVAAAATRIAFGTSAGHPETEDVIASLAELGVPVGRLDPAARQPAGVFVARGEDDQGRPLLVKVYGRDAYDTQLLEKLWRTVWYQDDGPALRLGRSQAVEHEALLTLVAAQAGVATGRVVTAGESTTGDAILVLREESRPLAELDPDAIDDELLAGAWRALELLHEARVAHLRIDPAALVLVGREVGLAAFERGTLTPRAEQLLTDRAQLLATTAALGGSERAVAVAVAALGGERVAELLPYLQPAAFAPHLRRALDDAGIEVDELRDRVAAAVGVEAPKLVRLRRVTWWSLVQMALLVLAATTILRAVGGLDLDQLSRSLEQSSWAWIVAAFLVAQLPRLTQALSTLGSVVVRLPFAPVYVMQLATGYMNLALPSNLARMAVNVRFFQRHGVPPAAAVTAGTIDSFVSTVIQGALLGLLLLFSESSLTLDLEPPSAESLRLLAVLACIVVAVLLGTLLVGRVRRGIATRARAWWPEVKAATLGLRAAHKLGLLLGGSLATEVLFALSLGMFANAMGYDIGFADLLLINISVSLLASFVPVPGGIGVAEFGLIVGLTAAGMPEEAALVAAVLYRTATFYVPPVWGFFAMRWLQRNAHL